MTYYDILGVPHNATQDQIKQAYRLQVRFFHPDLFDGPPEVADIKTKQLNEAYGVLGNPELRSQYDQILRMYTQPPPHQAAGQSSTTKSTSPPRSSNQSDFTAAYREREVRRAEVERRNRERKQFLTRMCIGITIGIAVVALIIFVECSYHARHPSDSSPAPAVVQAEVAQQPVAQMEPVNPVLTAPKDTDKKVETELIPTAKPYSGKVLSGKEYYNESEITITADNSSDYVVSLKSRSGTERVCFYVRAGDTVTVGVPAEHLYVYFASGNIWYGYGKGLMFGKNTIYSKDDELLDFTEYTWEYELYPVTYGNFSETPSNADEFF